MRSSEPLHVPTSSRPVPERGLARVLDGPVANHVAPARSPRLIDPGSFDPISYEVGHVPFGPPDGTGESDESDGPRRVRVT